MSEQLHPTVEEFKQFVQKNPAIVQEVRSGRKNWQQVYEDWYMLGETMIEPTVEKEKPKETTTSEKKESTDEGKSDMVSQIFNYVKKMDLNQLQSQIDGLGSALTAVQGVLSQFQANNQNNSRNNRSSRPNPFSFRKD